jgi:ABC-2 type transport system permease protein
MMEKTLGWLRLYLAMAGVTLRSRTAYRANFFLNLLFNFAMVTAELVVTLLLVHRVHGILGWTTDDVMLLYGLAATSAGVYRIFLAELHEFDRYLVNGEFDAVLTRPTPTWVTVASRSLDLSHLGWVLEGLVILVTAGHLLGLWHQHPLATAGELAIAIASGSLVWLALVTAVATLGFWTTRVDDLQPMVLYGPQTAATFPLSAYPAGLRAIFYTILPVAFGSYLPALVILHRGPPPALLWGCLGGSLLALVAALQFWAVGVRHYASTGT